MSVEMRQLQEMLTERKRLVRRVATRMVWQFLIVNFLCIVNIAIVMESVNRRDEDEAAAVCMLLWITINFLSLGWVRCCAGSTKKLRALDERIANPDKASKSTPPPLPPEVAAKKKRRTPGGAV